MYYSAEDEGLVLYAYPVSMSHQFEKVILYSDPSEYPYSTTVTYDTNLPLEMVDESLNSVKYEDFSLYFNAEDSTFYFYKDGDVVSSRKFHDKLKTLYRYYGFIETENKLIYKIYVYEKDGIPDIQFVYVASDMSFVKSKYGYSCQSLSGRDLNLPILQSKDSDRLYTIVPKDWDVYELYGSKPAINEYQPGCNYNFDLITLEDKFSYAEFDYYGSWDVELNFAIDGSLFAIEFDVDGYDSSFSLTDAEKEELSIRVYSFKEIWAHIEKSEKRTTLITQAAFLKCYKKNIKLLSHIRKFNRIKKSWGDNTQIKTVLSPCFLFDSNLFLCYNILVILIKEV